MNGQRILFAFVAIGIIGGLCAGAGAFVSGQFGPMPGTRPEYADTNGDGFVPAQGDPAWDMLYAQQVNDPNSQAVENLGQAADYQAAAALKQAEAERIQAGTTLTNILVGALIVILLFVVGFITIGMVLR